MKLVLVINKPPATGHTMAVNEVWRRRKGVPYTATQAPMCKLVVGTQPEFRAAIGPVGNPDGTCSGGCGYHNCMQTGPCEPPKGAAQHTTSQRSRYMHRHPERPSKWACGPTGCKWEAPVLLPVDLNILPEKTLAYQAWKQHECGVVPRAFEVGDSVRIKNGWPSARKILHVDEGSYWLSGLGDTHYRAEELEACTLHGAGPTEADAARERWAASGKFLAPNSTALTIPVTVDHISSWRAHCPSCFKDHGGYSTVSNRRDAERCCADNYEVSAGGVRATFTLHNQVEPRPFAVGDKARVVSSPFNECPPGTVGRVSAVLRTGSVIVSPDDGTNEAWCFSPSSLEHVDD